MENTEVPELNYSDNKIDLPTKEVPLKVNGEDQIVKLQQLSSGQRRKVMDKHLSTKIVGQQLSGEITNAVGIQIGILAEAIIEAQFPHKKEDLENMPENVIDYLYNEYASWTKKKQAQEK